MLIRSVFFLHEPELLHCSMSGKDCAFILILGALDKKHVFWFIYFFPDTAKQNKRKRKQPCKTEQPFLLSPNFSAR